jgi:ankyrin repeat protein
VSHAERAACQTHIEWLRKAAKERLAELCALDPAAKLNEAHRDVAKDYGFKSWRALKVRVEALTPDRPDRKRVFQAARAGDVETVRRAFELGFDPPAIDDDGRTIHQIAKANRFEAIELLARDVQGGETRPPQVVQAVDAILDAAWRGEIETLRARLDAHPELIDALGGGFVKQSALHRAACKSQHACLRLLLERGANVGVRDFPDNAYALHVAAAVADPETIEILVEAGSDVIGEGDDYEVGVLGWATCFRRVRSDVAAYLLDHGARLNLWTAIALDRADAVRSLVLRDPGLLSARMTRNQHRRTALHHAAAKNRPQIVALLLDLGADPNATDATGATPLTTVSQEDSDLGIVAMLVEAGAKFDFLTAVNLRRYDLAEAMLREEPARIGAEGRDTVALHLAVNKKNRDAVRWLIDHGVDVNAKRPMWESRMTPSSSRGYCWMPAPIPTSATTSTTRPSSSGPTSSDVTRSRNSSAKEADTVSDRIADMIHNSRRRSV